MDHEGGSHNRHESTVRDFLAELRIPTLVGGFFGPGYQNRELPQYRQTQTRLDAEIQRRHFLQRGMKL